MLTDNAAREHFQQWSSAPRLLVYDTDSIVLTEANNLFGLLRKFQIAGYRGELAWVKGGLTAVYKEARSLLELAPISPSLDDTPNESEDVLQPRNLPLLAFQQASTTLVGQSHPSALLPTITQPTPPLAAANPFYDNIRQNVELSQGVGDKIPLQLSPGFVNDSTPLPWRWIQNLHTYAKQADEGAETLALQFYRIELGEQRRLQGIMSHHSKEGASTSTSPTRPVTAPADFPFSITAGIEMGTKNRWV